jgi:uncharacterized protein YndB with AHSA1/START domain
MVPTDTRLVLRRSFAASPERIWALWTTPEGLGAWWAPEGFSAYVDVVDLRPGGSLVYTMRAIGRQEVAFMGWAGIPLATSSRKEFTVVDKPSRLAYTSLIDFVPDVEPYQHLTVVTFERTAGGTDVTMEMEPLHDGLWTDHLQACSANQLDSLARLVRTACLRNERRTY